VSRWIQDSREKKFLFCATVCRTEVSMVGILFNEDDWQRMTTRGYQGEKQFEGNISIGRRIKSVGRDAEKIISTYACPWRDTFFV
jgi:hypothetical protein